MDGEARRAASAAAVDRLASSRAFAAARSVLLYVAIGAELDPAALTSAAWGTGKDVWRPATPDLPPSWVMVDPDEAAAIAHLHGGPRTNAGTTHQAGPVLVVAPGVGFDRRGVRLGRGGGFYDRAIAALRREVAVTVVGLAYELQVVPDLPYDPWDQWVDLVVTERRAFTCSEPPPGLQDAASPFGGTR